MFGWKEKWNFNFLQIRIQPKLSRVPSRAQRASAVVWWASGSLYFFCCKSHLCFFIAFICFYWSFNIIYYCFNCVFNLDFFRGSLLAIVFEMFPVMLSIPLSLQDSWSYGCPALCVLRWLSASCNTWVGVRASSSHTRQLDKQTFFGISEGVREYLCQRH